MSAPGPAPVFHAVVLAGGRSARLGGRSKARLRRAGRTLLELTLDAVREAAGVVVVGPPDPSVPEGVLRTREDPPFSGPAAGIAAGLRALDRLPGADWTMTLACDMPGVSRAVPLLLEAARTGPDAAGYVCVPPGGHRQPLAALYRSDVLRAAYAGQDAADRSVFSFVRDLPLRDVTVPQDATADVDTWDDVQRHHLT
ncbi:molybdenum cofactor guanylyltransferase [uncultured Kocuria sp.]|uniref:molybdenum cofactor guanylyltransferase n=1 Tax=uncultured Kocuria sp. TaxID=259305 RepID=UPI00262EE0B1|nr:molybdenum cofactor guanylyltransferase [uncultured Kocuria sp.]